MTKKDLLGALAFMFIIGAVVALIVLIVTVIPFEICKARYSKVIDISYKRSALLIYQECK